MKLTNRRTVLVELRNNKSWSQKQVVEELQGQYAVRITESYYGMIEQGVRTPSLSVALAIAKLFEVEPEKIFLNNETTKSCVKSKQLA